MTFVGYLTEAMMSLRLNAVRSTLTAIGVIIGTAGIIVLGVNQQAIGTPDLHAKGGLTQIR